MKPRDWARLAAKAAERAHEDDFPSRWGSYALPGGEAVILFNNNPYNDDPGPGVCGRRALELTTFREWLEEHSVTELAFASYPGAEDEQPGYTYAIVLDCSVKDEAEITAAMNDALRKCDPEVTAATRDDLH